MAEGALEPARLDCPPLPQRASQTRLRCARMHDCTSGRVPGRVSAFNAMPPAPRIEQAARSESRRNGHAGCPCSLRELYIIRVIAIIEDPQQIRCILRHLVKIGRGRPAARLKDSIRLPSTDRFLASPPRHGYVSRRTLAMIERAVAFLQLCRSEPWISGRSELVGISACRCRNPCRPFSSPHPRRNGESPRRDGR